MLTDEQVLNEIRAETRDRESRWPEAYTWPAKPLTIGEYLLLMRNAIDDATNSFVEVMPDAAREAARCCTALGWKLLKHYHKDADLTKPPTETKTDEARGETFYSPLGAFQNMAKQIQDSAATLSAAQRYKIVAVCKNLIGTLQMGPISLMIQQLREVQNKTAGLSDTEKEAVAHEAEKILKEAGKRIC